MFSPKRVGESDHQPGGYVFVRLVSQSVDEKEGVTLVCSGQSLRWQISVWLSEFLCAMRYLLVLINHPQLRYSTIDGFYFLCNSELEWKSCNTRVNGIYIIWFFGFFVFFISLADELFFTARTTCKLQFRSHPQRDISIPRHHHHHQEHSSSSLLPG